ncbi:polysaccharide biosynthesis C-terminal domain-containing protein [Deinococcus ruber]|uniref:Epimerase n=1 Tax=Deinococcus ruber TaxID=1848197 RepID=A0A918FGC8_9DEIO|nr:NAD-dependent epimerase/dehydratase family protein [Deinococcus ruber]GGR36097.1 epimerase [Deinococcus ruber]
MARPLTVAVTGAGGLLGTHVLAYLRSLQDVTVRAATRETFTNDTLPEVVSGCDAVIHLAGMNRGDDAMVARINLELTHQLVSALQQTESRAHVLFSSSTHIERDTAYGASKRAATAVLREWADQHGGSLSNVILPGVFGEGGRPYYNSVVSTFCYQLATGETPTPHQDSPIEQIHAQEVARRFEQLIRERHAGDLRVHGSPLTVFGLLATLQDMHALYQQHIIPDLREDLRRDLFNTYRSYLYPTHYPVSLPLHTDARGSLFEAIKSPNGGQSFLSTTHPGITRGNHYHTRKVERFLVVGGEAEIRLRHLLKREIQSFRVSGERPSYIDIPTLHTHNITNVGTTPLMTLFWTHELFDPARPDTVAELVEPL